MDGAESGARHGCRSPRPRNDDDCMDAGGRATQDAKAEGGDPVASNKHCPKCNNEMVLRTAKSGVNKGNKFWGCSH